ncbi:hypothetical protein OAR19_00475 [bacterium]|nr:hypothetical protein [bacterium]
MFAGLKGNKFTDTKHGFEISVPKKWKTDVSGRKKIIQMNYSPYYADVGVRVLPLERHHKNAQGFALDYIIAYDGWQYIAGRRLNWLEKHGSDSGFCVMYTKRLFSGGREKKIIVQEYYFTKNKYAYVVTLITDSKHWYDAKDSLLYALKSFRIF